MDLSLDEAGYKSFLSAFRQADKDNASAKGETVVSYANGGRSAVYYFEAPNFKCCGYSIGGGAKITLTKYNHVAVGKCSRSEIETALLAGGGGGTVVTRNLSIVIGLISEAARSSVVERNMIKALGGGESFDFHAHEILFKNYAKTTDHMRFGGTGSGYLENWEPLKKWHYAGYFQASERKKYEKIGITELSEQPKDVLAVMKL